jgi:hypothetical protein
MPSFAHERFPLQQLAFPDKVGNRFYKRKIDDGNGQNRLSYLERINNLNNYIWKNCVQDADTGFPLGYLFGNPDYFSFPSSYTQLVPAWEWT